MLVPSRSFEETIQDIGPVIANWEDQVIPRRVEMVQNPRYSPRYAWMFSYERGLRDRIFRELGRKNRKIERLLFGAGGIVSEGLSNAFVHGHRRDIDRPIIVRCALSSEQLVITITDSGPGFDHEETLRKHRQGKNYYHIGGNGLNSFIENQQVEASYSDRGRCLTLKIPIPTR